MLLNFLLILLVSIQGGKNLQKDINQYLNENLHGYDKIEFKILHEPAEIKSAKLLADNPLNLTGDIAYVPVRVTYKNQRAVQSFITVKVKLYKKVYAAVRDIKYGEQLNKNDFTLKQINVAKYNGNTVSSTDSLSRYRSKINLKSGDVLLLNNIEKIPVIKIGDKIIANEIEGNVLIQVDALSRQDGNAGDIINIITADKKQFKAKVVDSHNVIIVE